MSKVKKAKRVLGAKEEVTENDAKKLNPLVKYWANRLKEARISDNVFVFSKGILLGGLIVSLFWLASL